MCANTFSITGHGLAAPEWAESYHSYLAVAGAEE
jgi:hypothetical protein